MAKDRFSQQSEHYQRYRPGYPPAVFKRLATLSPARQRVWDCGCGTGQASVPLSREFDAVFATDLSWQQLRNAQCADNISYCAATADAAPFADASFDMVSVAQALHWFNLPAFFAECDRVLKPGGLLVALTYNLLSVEPDIDPLIQHLYTEVLGDYWDAERRLVDSAYADIDFPFSAEPVDDDEMICHWQRDQLLGYLQTWSGLKQYRKATGKDALSEISPALSASWPDDEVRVVRWPLRCIVRRKALD